MITLKRKEALRDLLIFSLPVIFGHLGIMLIGTGDMVIAGRYSKEALAAIGLAIAICNPIMISLLGLQFAISPILAQKLGKGEEISGYFWTVIFYSVLVSIVSMVLTLLSVQLIPFLDYGPNLNRLIREYLIITSFSTFGLCLYQGVKEFHQAQENTMSANVIALMAVGVNIFFGYALVFGAFGMPQLYEQGLAWAALGVKYFMAIALLGMSWRLWKTPRIIKWDFIKEAWKLGLPISITLFFEIMAFCSVTLFVGKFSEDQTAANNLALNIGSLAFMIPMSISAAVSVKVGHSYGEKNFERIETFAQVSLFASFCFTLLMGLIFFFLPDLVLSVYTTDEAVLIWARKLLFWVACFQLFDGAQVTMSGILRGLNVTKASSLAIFIGYWMIGIPLGYYLGFHGGMEAQGFWVGLALSLALVALMLGVVLKRKMKALMTEPSMV